MAQRGMTFFSLHYGDTQADLEDGLNAARWPGDLHTETRFPHLECIANALLGLNFCAFCRYQRCLCPAVSVSARGRLRRRPDFAALNGGCGEFTACGRGTARMQEAERVYVKLLSGGVSLRSPTPHPPPHAALSGPFQAPFTFPALCLPWRSPRRRLGGRVDRRGPGQVCPATFASSRR